MIFDSADAPTRLIPRTLPLAPTQWRRVAFWAGLAAVPLGVGALVGRRSRTAGAVATALTALGLGALRWQLQRWFADEPAYTIEKIADGFEIRRYAARVEARTRILSHDFEKALEQGFHRLAGYIFGGNREGEELLMTAPVTTKGETLAMTAPVIASEKGGGFVMSFVMPPGRTRISLPEPVDPMVELVDIPARRVAVMRFRGRHSGEAFASAERELMHLVEGAGLVAGGTPAFAGFDPPTTLPLLRRNEVWVELA